ncbi:hypothetical protein ABFY54_29545 [Priestia megaterium]|uniref:hypothetical protein n=1 Tax=Priestia TaxID=2800373 RepID=UPI001C8DD2F0|nr:hypothetical protein [Priestia aryabhattai]MBY0214551.1 hypothetical protein [Priestia aryabhattai]MCM2978722.1 hypothetical protein [Priestia aryabhattai]
MAVDEIVEGKEYYLYKVHTDKRLGYEVYGSWDYVRLASHTDGGTPVVFEKDPENSSQYYIRMTECNYGGHYYLTRDSKGWIYLDKKAEASRFCFFLDAWGRIKLWHYHGDENNRNFKLHYRGGKNWLSTDGYKRYLRSDEPSTRTGERVEIDRDLFEVKNA